MQKFLVFHRHMEGGSNKKTDYFLIALNYILDTKKHPVTNRRITQAKIADKCGMNQSNISLLKSGKRTGSVNTRDKIATALDMNYGDMCKFGKDISNRNERNDSEMIIDFPVKDNELRILFIKLIKIKRTMPKEFNRIAGRIEALDDLISDKAESPG